MSSLDPQDPSQPKPLRLIAAIIGLMQVVVGLLPVFGISFSPEQIGGISAIVAALGAIAFILAGEPRVTPVASPRNNLGQRLVPVTPSRTEPEGYSGGTVLP